MGQPSLEPNDRLLLLQLQDQVRDLYRRRPRQQPNVRDLQDVNGWGAANGHALMYDATVGRYRPALSPPLLKFNQNGTLTVSSSDEDVMGGSGKLILVAARLKTTGSSTTTAILKHTTADGATTTSLATFTFASGSHTPTTTPPVAHRFVAGDYFWVDTTAAGTGAGGLVVNGWGTAGAA